MSGYSKDLSYIHDAGFTAFAAKAAAEIVRILRNSRLRHGLITDIGCGSGASARVFIDAGYTVFGIDISARMTRIARRRVPEAKFRTASIRDAKFPGCIAATAIGEVLNYRFVTMPPLVQTFRRVFHALKPGGFFFFDLLETVPADPVQRVVHGNDWLVISELQRRRNSAKRHIISLRKIGKYYRRTDEMHPLILYSKKRVLLFLNQVGFRARTASRFGTLRSRPGHFFVIARKPLRNLT